MERVDGNSVLVRLLMDKVASLERENAKMRDILDECGLLLAMYDSDNSEKMPVEEDKEYIGTQFFII